MSSRPSASAFSLRHGLLVFTCAFVSQLAVAADPFQGNGGGLYSQGASGVPVAPGATLRSAQDPAPGNLKLRNGLIIGSGATLVMAYGFTHWWQSGLGGGFQTTNEGWLGSGTPFGGADKFGHLYANYAGVRLLTPLFEMAGNGREASVSLALWSTLGVYTAVELIDGFSRKWNFSPQDAIANMGGVLLGRALETHPELDAILDFRLDYRRSPRSAGFDPFGDYSAEKFLFVVKADGFPVLRDNAFLRYLEVAAGYGTRGYGTSEKRYRDTYVGLSLNLARLLSDVAYGGRMHSTAFQHATDRVFDLVQFPTIAYVRWSAE